MLVACDEVLYIPKVTYKKEDYQLISCPTGKCMLVKHHRSDATITKFQHGQHLISEDEIIAEKVKQGIRTEEFIKELLETETLEHLKHALVVFNIYTFQVNFLDKRRLFGLLNIKGETNLSYLGYSLPPNVSVLDEVTRQVHQIPDISLPKIKYGVKEELIFINLELLNDISKVQDGYELASALIRTPVSSQ